MLSSSKNDGKHEARFAARLDVLMERVDTLASTVGTTASAIAKKDGEIAALRRDLEARDQTLQALVQHVNRAAEAPAADVPVDATELRSLRNAVAALTKERASGVNAAQIQSLIAAVRALDERTGALSAAAAAPPVPTTDPATIARIDAVAAELAVVRAALDRPPEELVAMVSMLRERVDDLAAREEGVTAAQLEHRLGATNVALATQSQRLEALTETLEGLQRKLTVEEAQLDRRLHETDEALDRASRGLDSLATQSSRLDALAETVGELERTRNAAAEQLDSRLVATDDALAKLSHRLDALGERLGGLENTGVLHEERLDHRFRKTNDALTNLSQRVDSFESVDQAQVNRRFSETDDALTTLAERLDTVGETLGQVERTREIQEERFVHRFGTTSDALASLSRRLDALQSVDQAHLDRRLGETDEALTTIAERLDTLAGTVESATAGLREKERELATLQHHFTESSTRIESIVDDIRAALHALPVPSSTSLDELASRLERMDTATREATEASARTAGDLSSRIDLVDHRLATVAEEVSRARTLWPVALRSLEARLDDAVHGRRPDDSTPAAPAGDEPDDVLAGLRDGLHAMETVAAEMARAAETLAAPGDAEPTEAPAVDAHTVTPPPQPEQASAVAGATIVPLRATEP